MSYTNWAHFFLNVQNPPQKITMHKVTERDCISSKAVDCERFRFMTAVSCCFVARNFFKACSFPSSRFARFKMVWTDTPRKPFSRYHGIAMLFLKTGIKSSGTCSKKSFISIPPWRASVSRTRMMFFLYSAAQRSSWVHQMEEKMPSVIKNKNARQLMTPFLIVSCNPSFMSTSTSTKIFNPGLTSRKNICIAMMVSCALRCKCERKKSYISPLLSVATPAELFGPKRAKVSQRGSSPAPLAIRVSSGPAHGGSE
mmetsp:Transcript_20597/g.59656  ORF Transcript_20597/g.59656 Transcript_20597/m.59656 type:complete len:255 (-) Transcript_20597:342-1106(-)